MTYKERLDKALADMNDNETILAFTDIKITPYFVQFIAVSELSVEPIFYSRDFETKLLTGEPHTRTLTNNKTDLNKLAKFIAELRNLSDDMLIDKMLEEKNNKQLANAVADKLGGLNNE
jgi:hypothetical protein